MPVRPGQPSPLSCPTETMQGLGHGERQIRMSQEVGSRPDTSPPFLGAGRTLWVAGLTCHFHYVDVFLSSKYTFYNIKKDE